jgi:hypothetical protein
MMDHERARELSLMPATDVDPADHEWLAAHLDGCEACRTFVANAVSAHVAVDEDEPGAAAVRRPRPSPTYRRRLVDRMAITEPLRRRAVVGTVAAVAVAIVAGGLAWNTSPRTDLTVADASQPPRSTSPASPGSSEGRDPWASLEPSGNFEPMAGESPAPTAALTARGARGAVVPLDATFRLASLDAVSYTHKTQPTKVRV